MTLTWKHILLGLFLMAFISQPELLLAEDQVTGKSTTMLTIKGIFEAGGTIGYIIVLLSILMFVLILQNLLVLRKSKLVPEPLKIDTAELVSGGQFAKAQERLLSEPSLLTELVVKGLAEVDLSYQDIEKAMEEAAAEQSARLIRRLEYLNLIGTIAPMLGLLGTVWGMILTFEQFSANSNPQIADLAPGISAALVTTLFGLIVAIPALSAYALFRNQVDALMAESAAAAEFIFSSFRRLQKKKQLAQATTSLPPRKPIPSVTLEREKPE